MLLDEGGEAPLSQPPRIAAPPPSAGRPCGAGRNRSRIVHCGVQVASTSLACSFASPIGIVRLMCGARGAQPAGMPRPPFAAPASPQPHGPAGAHLGVIAIVVSVLVSVRLAHLRLPREPVNLCLRHNLSLDAIKPLVDMA